MKFPLFIILMMCSTLLAQKSLKLNLEINEEYVLYSHSEMSMVQTINFNKNHIYVQTAGKTLYKVIDKDESYIHLEVTMDELSFMMSSPYLHLYYDSTEEQGKNINSLNKIFSALNGLKFNLTLSPNGHVDSTNYLAVLSDTFDSAVQSMGIAIDSGKYNEAMNKLKKMSPAKNFQKLIAFFPENKVSVGDSWIVDGEIDLGFPLKYDRTVNYLSESKDYVRLSSISSIVSNDYGQTEKMFEKLTYIFDGSEEYDILLDKNTGWFKAVNGSTKLDGIVTYITENGDTLRAPSTLKISEYYGLEKY